MYIPKHRKPVGVRAWLAAVAVAVACLAVGACAPSPQQKACDDAIETYRTEVIGKAPGMLQALDKYQRMVDACAEVDPGQLRDVMQEADDAH